MKNTSLLVHCISNFEGTSYKKLQDTASLPVPLFLVVLHPLAFTSADFIFYNFLEPNPTFSDKRFLSQVFIF